MGIDMIATIGTKSKIILKFEKANVNMPATIHTEFSNDPKS